MTEKVNEMMKILTATTGMSKEALLDNFTKELPEFIEAMKKDNIDLFSDLIEKKKSEEKNE